MRSKFKPISKWTELMVPEPVIQALEDLGFNEPTPIQRLSIPAAIRDKQDILGAAPTGSGKTLAFGIPIVEKILRHRPEKNVGDKCLRGLILTPTRELAIQIKKHLDDICAHVKHVSIGCLVGGLAIPKQERILNKFKPDIIVATPGRLWEIIENGSQDHITRESVANLDFLVIDEADRMTEKGHFQEMMNVIGIFKRGPEIVPEDEIQELKDDEEAGEEESEQVIDDDDETVVTKNVKKKKTKSDDFFILDGKKHLVDEVEDVFGDVDLSKFEMEESSDDEKEDEEQKMDQDNEEPATENEPANEEADPNQDEDLRANQDEDLPANQETAPNQSSGSSKKPKMRQILVFSATLTFVHDEPSRLKLGLQKRSKVRKNAARGKNSLQSKLSHLIELFGMREDKVKILDMTEKERIGRPDSNQLRETCITCKKEEKDLFLFYFLSEFQGRTIVFVNSLDCLRRLITICKLLQLSPIAIHSGFDQKKRLQALEKFSSCPNSGLLIASDIAARGLDIVDIDHVIHYQVPRTSETYVHRSGRTARGSKIGVSCLLVEPKESINYRKLCSNLNGGKHFELLPIKENILNDLKVKVQLAQQIDILEHSLSKVQVKSNWFKKAAQEMDIDVHDRDDLFDERHQVDTMAKKRSQVKVLKQKLAAMLKFKNPKRKDRIIRTSLDDTSSNLALPAKKSAFDTIGSKTENKKEWTSLEGANFARKKKMKKPKVVKR